MDQRLGNCVAVNNRSIRAICLREVFVQEFIPGLHSRIVLPLRIRWVLEVSRRDDALCVFHAGRLDHAADRDGHVVEKVQRLPFDFGHLLDRLRREFRRCDVEEHVGVQRLQLDDVRIDGRLCDLEAFLDDDHRRRLGAETVFQAFQIILAVIIVLIEHGDLGVRLLLQDILRVDP